MKKILLLAGKDIRLAFRDRAAILLMLAAPFLLTLGMGLITGRLSASAGSSSGPSNIPVLLINRDGAQLGDALVELFQSADLADLLEPQVVTDEAAARLAVEQDTVAGVITIPAGFTASIIPGNNLPQANPAVVQIEFLANPARPNSASIIEAILREYLSRVEESRLAGATAVAGLLRSGALTPAEAAQAGSLLAGSLADLGADSQAILALEVEGDDTSPIQGFDVMAYMAPGMALLFLMFTVTYGGRSFLAERRQRTLQRLLTTPTAAAQVLSGKMLGIFLTGILQLVILIGASSLLFGLNWGDWLGVLVLINACAFAATSWGLLITSLARTPGQVATVGSALMLLFGLLGGSFIDLAQMPSFVQVFSRITPNAWGLDGFTILALGGGLADLVRPLSGLLVMGVVLFLAAAGLFARNRSLVQ